MRRSRAVLLAAAAVLATGATGCAPERSPGGSQPVRSSGRADIGGPFTLIDQNGRTVTDRDLLGRPTVVFFGFTFCPEICPTTLQDLTSDLETLGPAADRLNVVFVTVDPERDRPEQLRQYLSAFDRRIRGLTGTPEQVAAMEREYRVISSREALPGGGYTMNHTSYLMLFDARGAFVEPVAYGETPERRRAALQRLLS